MSGALDGKRILNTRAAHQAESLNILLRRAGALPLAYPCIAIVPPADAAPLDAALARLASGDYDWLALTSANTAYALGQRLASLGLKLADGPFQVAAVGPATADAAQTLGLTVALLPENYLAEGLAASLPVEPGARVLLPESAIARPALATLLAERGAAVDVVTAYQTVRGTGGINASGALAEGGIDALTFTSSSTVTYFLERLADEGGQRDRALSVPAVCIGPQTAATARDCGFAQVIVAQQHTLDGLVDALERYFVSSPERNR
jgi:uroporphyrinogen-III synthase